MEESVLRWEMGRNGCSWDGRWQGLVLLWGLVCWSILWWADSAALGYGTCGDVLCMERDQSVPLH